MGVIGRGGHSLIYRAVERAGEGEFAVKVLHDGVPYRRELEVRLEREYDSLVALSGTAAPRVFELCREDGALCLVMEYLHGQDFDEYLEDLETQGRRLEVPTLVEIVDPIVNTLERAHHLGIVHRDLKPGNLFVLGRGGPGGVRLLDFGLARSASTPPITRDGFVIGSPSYIAPEVWEGNPRSLDLRVDVYSMAAIIYRALAGQVPFPVTTLKEKMHAAKAGERPSLHALRAELPPSIDGWLGQALAVDRDRRFTSVRGLWRSFLSTLGVRAEGMQDGQQAS